MAEETSSCLKCKGANATKKCSRCRIAAYCNETCQSDHWKTHKTSCVPENVSGIVIRCEGERRRGVGPFEVLQIARDHKIHTEGVKPPLPKHVGVPLVLYRHVVDPGMPRDARWDNQIATYLMIEMGSGFAPFEFQQQVGTVTVMRADYKPLTKEQIETIWMYHDHVLDLFGDSQESAHAAMNKKRFRRFCETYKEDCITNGRTEFEGLDLPI